MKQIFFILILLILLSVPSMAQKAADIVTLQIPHYDKDGSKKRLSKHALGLAIDINPLYNPYVKGSIVKPERGRKYFKNPQIKKNGLVYRLFIKHGFKWGGDWRTLKDYQHFEK